MDQTLLYLREILSNYTEEFEVVREIDDRISSQQFSSEGSFVESLSEEEIRFLEEILKKEIHHANQAGDFDRVYQLNEVYELLY
jgi:Minor curli fiber component A